MKSVLSILNFLLLSCSVLSGQADGKIFGCSLPAIQKMLHNETPIPNLLTWQTKQAFHSFVTTSEVTETETLAKPMPLAYAYKDLALFCKLEVQLEKAVKIPIKFRLGSVDYVDWLEGKRDRY